MDVIIVFVCGGLGKECFDLIERCTVHETSDNQENLRESSIFFLPCDSHSFTSTTHLQSMDVSSETIKSLRRTLVHSPWAALVAASQQLQKEQKEEEGGGSASRVSSAVDTDESEIEDVSESESDSDDEQEEVPAAQAPVPASFLSSASSGSSGAGIAAHREASQETDLLSEMRRLAEEAKQHRVQQATGWGDGDGGEAGALEIQMPEPGKAYTEEEILGHIQRFHRLHMRAKRSMLAWERLHARSRFSDRPAKKRRTSSLREVRQLQILMADTPRGLRSKRR